MVVDLVNYHPPGLSSVGPTSAAKLVILLGCSCTSLNRRWEVPVEGVILDGQLLPVSNLSGSGSGLSALLDTVIIV